MESERPANTYLVCGVTPWARRVFDEIIKHYPSHWFYFDRKDIESGIREAEIFGGPLRYIFFLHWRHKVPETILKDYECIGCHMTELPFGRGGSPLQNMIQRGIRETVVTAFRITEEMDAGPIYMHQPLSLEGLAEEIYIRAMHICADMVREIVSAEPALVPREVPPMPLTVFKRRTPPESEIPELDDLLGLFDFIRMLDAEGYPHAFLRYEGYRYEFSRPAFRDGRIMADVTITQQRQLKTLLGFPVEYVDTIPDIRLDELELGEGFL